MGQNSVCVDFYFYEGETITSQYDYKNLYFEIAIRVSLNCSWEGVHCLLTMSIPLE